MTPNEWYMYESGYWKSEHSGKWYQKVYKNAERKIYNWLEIIDEDDIFDLENGIIPEMGVCGYDLMDDDTNV